MELSNSSASSSKSTVSNTSGVSIHSDDEVEKVIYDKSTQTKRESEQILRYKRLINSWLLENARLTRKLNDKVLNDVSESEFRDLCDKFLSPDISEFVKLQLDATKLIIKDDPENA